MAEGVIPDALSLGIQVVKILDGLITDWQDVPKEVERSKRELEYLIAILHKTSQILARKRPGPQPPQGNAVELVRTDYINFCTTELENLHDALSIPKTTPCSKGWDRIKRALRSEKLKQSMDQVKGCSQYVSHDISIETLVTAQASKSDIEQIQDAISVVSERTHRKDRSKILSWISIFDPRERHEFLQKRHHKGSGQWLIKREDFMDWCTGCREDAQGEPVPPILWCYGMPGAGKSIMTSFVIELLKSQFGRLQGDAKIPIIYAYCDYKERNRQTIEDLMSILLRQLVLHIEVTQGIPPEVLQAYDEHASGESRMRRSELQALLTTLLKTFRRSMIVLDALDEYVPPEGDAHSIKAVGIFDELQKVMKECGDSCRMFVTSRENCMRRYDTVHATRLRIAAAEEDVRSYVSEFLRSNEFPYAEEVSEDPELATLIRERLVENANGQFLLPALHLKDLSLQPSIRDLVDALDTLPTELDDVYSIAVNRIRDQSQNLKDLGMQILAWVNYAARRLTIDELRHAIATRPNDTLFRERGLIKPKELITRTAGLLQFQNGKVECVHHTITEFLKKPGRADLFPNAQTEITLTCLTYLQFSNFKDPTDDVENRATEFPFLGYAARHWGYHATRCIEHEPTYSKTFSDVLSKDQIPLGSLQIIAAKVLQNPVALRIPTWKKDMRPLQMAIVCGLDSIVETILSQDEVDTEEIGYKGETALHTAARSSSQSATKLLLSRHANVNATNYSGKTALDMIMIAPYQRVSAKTQEPEILKNLILTLLGRLFAVANQSSPHKMSEIDKSIKASMESRGVNNAIHFVVNYRDRPEASRLRTKMLLARGYKMDISDEDEQIVKLLVEAGIDINSQGAPEATALQLAAIDDRQELAQLLVDNGANPFLQRDFGRTAYELAKHCGHYQIADMLSQKMEELQKLEIQKPDESAKLKVPGPLQSKKLEERVILEHQDRIYRMCRYEAEGSPNPSFAGLFSRSLLVSVPKNQQSENGDRKKAPPAALDIIAVSEDQKSVTTENTDSIMSGSQNTLANDPAPTPVEQSMIERHVAPILTVPPPEHMTRGECPDTPILKIPRGTIAEGLSYMSSGQGSDTPVPLIPEPLKPRRMNPATSEPSSEGEDSTTIKLELR